MKAIAAAVIAAVAAAGSAAACEAGKPAAEMDAADAAALYDCLSAEMADGYRTGPKRWIPESHVAGYRDWRAASTGPAAPGYHGGRMLMTWVNDVGWADYVDWSQDGSTMPAGTVIAKESFDVSDDGVASPGPLFLMEKAAAGTSPRSNDWLYMMVSPAGAPVAVEVMAACHSCHAAFEESDGLGYPVEEMRVGN